MNESGFDSRKWQQIFADACEYGNEPSGSINFREFLD